MKDIDLKIFINNKFIYDDEGQIIWHEDKDGGLQKIADLRGFGAIQNLFINNKTGKTDLEKAEGFQDKLGQWIVNSLNKNINCNEE